MNVENRKASFVRRRMRRLRNDGSPEGERERDGKGRTDKTRVAGSERRFRVSRGYCSRWHGRRDEMGKTFPPGGTGVGGDRADTQGAHARVCAGNCELYVDPLTVIKNCPAGYHPRRNDASRNVGLQKEGKRASVRMR